MKGCSSALIKRLSTVSSCCPQQIRAELLDAMLGAVSGEMALFATCANDAHGARHFTGGVLRGHDKTLIDWIRPVVNGPALDAPWLPPHTAPLIVNNFVRIEAFYGTRQLHSYEIVQSVFDPMEVGDQLRAVLFDGPRFLGWVGVMRRGAGERFRAAEERTLKKALGHIKAALAAADALESQTLADAVFAVSTPAGIIDHASPAFSCWLTPDRQAFLTRRIRALDRGSAACGTQVFAGAEVRFVRLDGPAGVRYLVTVSRANIIHIPPQTWLTPRQLEIAEYAAAGATTAEIARALSVSPHTVKTHLKNIYERLHVSTRLELAEKLAG